MENLKLINDCEVFQKERPNKITEKQKKKVFLETADEIIQWRLADSERDLIAEDLESIYDSCSTGFELAKELEDSWSLVNYTFSSNLVEILETLSSSMDDEKRKNIKEWVKAHDIRPNLKKGQKVKLKLAPFFSFNVNDEVFINYFREETAQYVIDKDPNKKGGTLVDYEKLESCI